MINLYSKWFQSNRQNESFRDDSRSPRVKKDPTLKKLEDRARSQFVKSTEYVARELHQHVTVQKTRPAFTEQYQGCALVFEKTPRYEFRVFFGFFKNLDIFKKIKKSGIRKLLI